jgi:hypothetical protein
VHITSLVSLVWLPILLGYSDLAAQVETNANIAAGLDISDSIGPYEEWLERVGTAPGLASRTFIEAVLSGRHGRVGGRGLCLEQPRVSVAGGLECHRHHG